MLQASHSFLYIINMGFYPQHDCFSAQAERNGCQMQKHLLLLAGNLANYGHHIHLSDRRGGR